MPRAKRIESRDERPITPPANAAPARGAIPTKKRKERVPLGVPRAQLAVPQRQGYTRRWINDDGKGRLQKAQEGGYNFVDDPDLRVGEDDGGSRTDSRVSRVVGTKKDNTPLRAYLMEIPDEYFREDQASKQAELDEVDRAIKHGRLVADGEQHRYVPEKGRAIKVEKESAQTAPADLEEDD